MTGDMLARNWRKGSARATGVLSRIYQTLGRWDSRGRITIAALAIVTAILLFGVLWGGFVADPDINVQKLDYGPVSQFAIGKVVPEPDTNVYLVGIQDGRIRAIDGIVETTGCAVEWHPDDQRTVVSDGNGVAGAYVDPCSGGVWNIYGDAVSGAKDPLRTFDVDYQTGDDGVQHLWVEVIGDRSGKP
jgi:hypothetical protein